MEAQACFVHKEEDEGIVVAGLFFNQSSRSLVDSHTRHDGPAGASAQKVTVWHSLLLQIAVNRKTMKIRFQPRNYSGNRKSLLKCSR
jgi:hypothetical protein